MLGLPLFLSCLVVLSYSTEPITEGSCTTKTHDGTILTSTTILKDSTVDDVQLYYVDKTKVVFLKTDKTGTRKGVNGTLYRSSDGGRTWDLQSTVLPQFAGESILRIFTSRSSSSTLYFLGSGSKLWVTTNAGQSYRVFPSIPAGIVSLSPNDLEANVVLGRNISAVFISTNYGETWQKIMDVPRMTRAVVTWSIFSNQPHKRLYAKVPPQPRVLNARNDYDSVLVYTDDFFQTNHTLPVNNVYSWYMAGPDKIVVIRCTDVSQCSAKEMYISEDAGVTFFQSSFPDFEHETKNETSIRPLEVSDDVIWTVVRRYCKTGGSTYCYGDLYHSYAADKEFTHSLSETKLLRDRLDFTKYNSLDGIYLVNQYFDVEQEDANDVRTLITFNKGSTWNVVKAPTKDANGQPTHCEIKDGCSLHLHGWLEAGNGFDGFYSPPNAIGLMVASGNMGDQLLDRKDEVNFYYSRNGGIDWQEVRSGRYVPEVGNHGTVVVAANIGDLTNALLYTVDEGDSWDECTFYKDKIDVRNVRVSQGWDTTDFILYGHLEGNAYLVHVDFSRAYTGKCAAADFEVWSPTDEHGDCFMGHKIQYTRRAVGHPCFLDEEHIHETKAVNCACTAWDYECAECYFRPTLSAPCQFACVKNSSTPVPPPPTKDFCDKSTAKQPLFYTLTEPTGYTLIPENTCDPKKAGSHLPPPALVNCEEWKDLSRVPETPTGPEEPHDYSVGYTIMAIVFLALVVAGIVYLYKTNDRFKAKVSATLGWKTEERDASYQQISTTIVSSDEELSHEAPQISDQLESSSETSS